VGELERLREEAAPVPVLVRLLGQLDDPVLSGVPDDAERVEPARRALELLEEQLPQQDDPAVRNQPRAQSAISPWVTHVMMSWPSTKSRMNSPRSSRHGTS
jgi:hypothetical protein